MSNRGLQPHFTSYLLIVEYGPSISVIMENCEKKCKTNFPMETHRICQFLEEVSKVRHFYEKKVKINEMHVLYGLQLFLSFLNKLCNHYIKESNYNVVFLRSVTCLS